MEGKLIKTDTGNYVIETDKGILSSTFDTGKFEHKLSLKNCQAIERGYDLDELAKEEYCSSNNPDFDFDSYFKGFQKALEILGDKKFSDVNMEDAYYFGSRKLRGEYLDFIKTFQQTEWDVTFNPEELDAEGCLILKRKL